jgi:hypothetical protein
MNSELTIKNRQQKLDKLKSIIQEIAENPNTASKTLDIIIKHYANKDQLQLSISNTGKNSFISNVAIMLHMIDSLEAGEMTPGLAMSAKHIVTNYAKRPNFNGYTFIEDMIGDALLAITIAWHKFDPEKSENPFAYFTAVTHNAFIRKLGDFGNQRDITAALSEHSAALTNDLHSYGWDHNNNINTSNE